MTPFKSALAIALLAALSPVIADEPIDFNRSIQPILSDTCYKCHGPDQQQRKTDLRLDDEKSAFAEHDGTRALVAGSLDKSELFRRITSTDPDVRMPPPASGLKLSANQIQKVGEWIKQGAKWQRHWAFVTPRRHSLPAVTDPTRCWNEVDYFVQKQLQARKLPTVSKLASRETLIRRVTLDLTGMPPTLNEIDQFLADRKPGAYGRLVDRLLASPRFGERMASRWLDAARYADTSGYQNDGPRYMWRWRDWVIQALNRNMPFDQFTIEQLAGDMLPKPTLQQRIATGFNRNHRGNAEGGIIPEEYAVEYVIDRVDTTATVWLGLTMGCARCHDHKYDPISQSEFYQVFSYFNNVPEYGRAIKEGNSPPFIKAPTEFQREEYRQLKAQLAQAREKWQAALPQVDRKQQAWERKSDLRPNTDWTIVKGLVAEFQLDPAGDKLGVAKPVKFDGSYADGVRGKALVLDGSKHADGGERAKFGYFDKFSIAIWIKPEKPSGTLVSKMVLEERGKGYYLHLEKGKVQVNLVSRWLDDSLRVESVPALPANQWSHVGVVYDGSRVADAITIYINGKPVEKKVNLDGLNQTFAVDEPLRIGGGSTNLTGMIDEVRIYNRPLSAVEMNVVSTSQTLAEIVAVPRAKRPPQLHAKLTEYFRRVRTPKPMRDNYWRLLKLQSAETKMVESWPTVMVMQEMTPRKPSFILKRGQYDLPQDRVSGGIPASLNNSKNNPTTRLDFARWLVSPANPLTARVTVNRYWQMLFGQGLVRTVEDFGAQGERPSHPQLLDWLAVEFVESGWDTKAILRKIVMSNTYRRSSAAPPAVWVADPDNRWLTRGPRVRLAAETIRDQALKAAGLLQEKLGGPSVKPYQPDGLWREIATDTDYEQSHGADLYRRGLYTYWKRTVAPPQLSVFDAASRETCIVRQSRTNTPLQALATLNDVTYIEASRGMAQRVLRTKASTEARLAQMFRLVLSRRPTKTEAELLGSAWKRHYKYFSTRPQLAAKLTKFGELPREASNIVELAAYTTLANMILNLDEAITKE